jgi:hypothetical protein
MKLRAIVWSLVGVVVVIGVVFLLATRRKSPQGRLDLEGVRRQAAIVSGKLASLDQDLALARAQLPPDRDPAVFAPVEQAVMDARNILDEAQRLENVSAASDKLREARKRLSLGTRKLRELTRPKRPSGM